MGKTVFVKELEENQKLEGELFVVKEVKRSVTRNGKDFYKMVLADRTGDIGATLWSDKFQFCDLNLATNNIVKISGLVETYRQVNQINIHSLVKTQDFDPTDFLPASQTDPQELYKKSLEIIKQIKQRDLRELVEAIYTDPEMKDKITVSPGAEKVHHAYVGGLLEHTLEMISLAQPYSQVNPHINQDVLTAGILLHDIGKALELEASGVTISRTIAGKLEGHLALGYSLIQRYYPQNFPPGLKAQINHIIVAHHGEIENGSPVRPQTLEAYVVYLVDLGSSYLNQFQRAVSRGLEGTEEFSDYEKWLGRTIYLDPYRTQEDPPEKDSPSLL